MCQLTQRLVSAIIWIQPIQRNAHLEGGNNMELVTLIWLGLVIVFLVVEAACPIHLVSIWFAAGSLVALLVSYFHGPLWLQIAVFLVVSGVLLVVAGNPLMSWLLTVPIRLS